jgi:thiamine pyrophosphate-dependent acetolactate synthase large subunit-like protein
MKVGEAIAEIMKREGFEILFAYPVNHLIEHAANLDIRTVIVRQERVGLHMADALSRVTSGDKIGAFCMQHGPGTENAYGGVAQAFSESIPILVVPGGYPRRTAQVGANYYAAREMRGIAKMAESITTPDEVVNVMRRAMSRIRNGRGGPSIVEVPGDLWNAELTGELNYKPVVKTRTAPDPVAVKEAAKMLVKAKRPVLYVGQGVHWAKAWKQVKQLAEHLAIPVVTSLEGKSAFDETHPLSLGSGGVAVPKPVRHFLDNSDVIFGVGCSFTETSFGVPMPKGKKMIHNTLDEAHLNKDIYADIALIGDSGLTLDAIIEDVKSQVKTKRDAKGVAKEIADIRKAWLKEWMPRLTSNEAPLSPYRVLHDLHNTVDVANTIITHDAGSPRDQLSPFWQCTEPLTYIGWGKTTQLGYGLGLAMGAKLAHPDKLCINVWGDAAIGFTGMDFETCVRERIPIMSILLNNFSMAIEIPIMPISQKKYQSTEISGDYAAMARAFGGYGERITDPKEIIPAIKRGIAETKKGKAVLLEFITKKETVISRYQAEA